MRIAHDSKISKSPADTEGKNMLSVIFGLWLGLLLEGRRGLRHSCVTLWLRHVEQLGLDIYSQKF